MMEWVGQVLLCAVLFGATAYFACRDRPAGGVKKTWVLRDAKRAIAFSNTDPMRQDSERARSFVHKRILWMCGVWILLCAPTVAFTGMWHLNWRTYVPVLQVCLLLGFNTALGAYNRLAGRPRLLSHQSTALAKRNRATLKDAVVHALVLVPSAAVCIWLGRQPLWAFGVAAVVLLAATVWYYRWGLSWVDANAMLQNLPLRRR
jgi:hypothetical protein